MVTVHPNALKHGLTEQEVRAAWESCAVGAVRVPGEVEVRIGADPSAAMLRWSDRFSKTPGGLCTTR